MVAKQEAAKVATKTILKPIIKNPLTLDDIEAAGQLIVDQMPDYVGELLDELAKQAYLPKWQLIGGILFEAYNNGYMSAYTLDPAWKDGFKLEMSECNFCHQEFMPVRVGQLFCCNECGQGRTKLSEVKKEGKKNDHTPTVKSTLNKSTRTDNTKPLPTNKSTKAGWTDPDLSKMGE